MPIELYGGALGLGLAHGVCTETTCGCTCKDRCECTTPPTAVSLYLQLDEYLALDWECTPCATSVPIEVILDAVYCNPQYKYDPKNATRWLYQDHVKFCEVGCSEFGGTQYTTCSGSGCGAGGVFDWLPDQEGLSCFAYTPICVIGCFEGVFDQVTSCIECTYTGFDDPPPDTTDFRMQYKHYLRAMMGNFTFTRAGSEGDTCITMEQQCGILFVHFIKVYYRAYPTCTDMVLGRIIRKEYFARISGTCCGVSTCDVIKIKREFTAKCANWSPEGEAVDDIIFDKFFKRFPCLAKMPVVPAPGMGWQAKAKVYCA